MCPPYLSSKTFSWSYFPVCSFFSFKSLPGTDPCLGGMSSIDPDPAKLPVERQQQWLLLVLSTTSSKQHWKWSMHRFRSQSCQWMDASVNFYVLKIRNMFGFWVSAELALSAHPALHLHGKPVQGGSQREEGFTDACWLPFQLACSDLNKAVQELMSWVPAV